MGLLFKLLLGLYATGGFALQQSLSMANITAGSAVATTPEAIGLKPLLGRLYFGGGLVFPIGRGGNGLTLGAQYFTDQDNASENFPNKRLFRDMQVQLGWTFSK